MGVRLPQPELRPHRLAVRTAASHAANGGSIPPEVTILGTIVRRSVSPSIISVADVTVRPRRSPPTERSEVWYRASFGTRRSQVQILSLRQEC